MAEKPRTGRSEGGLDPALVQLCRSMTPVQRLEAAIRLSEVLLEFHRAGVRHRESLREAQAKADRQP